MNDGMMSCTRSRVGRSTALQLTSHRVYELLGVAAFASVEEIQKAYRRVALRAHPDKGGSEEYFKKLGHVALAGIASVRMSVMNFSLSSQ